MTIYRIDFKSGYAEVNDWEASCHIKTLKSAFEYILANVNQSTSEKRLYTIDKCYRIDNAKYINGDITLEQIEEYYRQHPDMRVHACRDRDTFRIVAINVIED